ncbi:hypothetical protein [Bradymonas sediminis]|uniref:Uncharacterized protein n=1 Tax=Bradymonas sediminis TaxID=1548548 RepID=A0A2Z4FIY2_9DELT|nr:hypothetical protein [Bradymonas sediminis]AWV88873.1 hypothetical protein DN745_05775 [Bradymonas sediminis]TDP71876.1 hypothetical protein DFR33_10890 [Bradymonas sediminis]
MYTITGRHLTLSILISLLALSGCSDAPASRNDRTLDSGVSDAGHQDADTAGEDPDTAGEDPDTTNEDADAIGEDADTTPDDPACQVDDDCESNANQNAECDTTTNTCVLTCDDGFADCDADSANGCEVDLSADLENCGACGTVCTATNLNYLPLCAPDPDTGGVCKVDSNLCLEGFVDLNGDTSDGCECEITNPNDPIDADGLDGNCDGVDGILEDIVFVAPSGDDTANDGFTPDAPLATLSAALQAAADNGRHHIQVAGGTYQGALVLKDGISIYGGYKASGFARDIANETTTIVAAASDFDTTTTAYITVKAEAITNPTTLDNLTIEGFDATNDGASTFSVYALNAPGLTLQSTTVRGGVATAGSDGADGSQLTSAPAPEGGGGGVASDFRQCGAGASSANPGSHGQNFTTDAGTGGSGGQHKCNENAASGLPGKKGAPGTPGVPGILPADGVLGNFDATGTWIPALATPPTDGTSGGGGGGGGAGGNHHTDTLSSCTVLPPCFYAGTAGGDGGDGGYAGGAGTNGSPGGSSFAIVVLDAAINIEQSRVILGKGGNGGDGGYGALGQENGSSTPTSSDAPDSPKAGKGGDGGYGGDGGHGGNGAGGQGGNAIGLATYGATVDSTGITFDSSNAAFGAGGAGARRVGVAALDAPDGRDGVKENVKAFGTSN